jgi:hypothetical protein
MSIRSIVAAAVTVTLWSTPAFAQHDMSSHTGGPVPTAGGQAAFATIAEIVTLLTNDPTTDWSKVDLEALRQHLIDMDDVVLHAAVTKRDVPGGMEATVTGTGRTAQAIRRMVTMHGSMLAEMPQYQVATVEVPNGVRFTVTAKVKDDGKQVARIRGLGFVGLLTEGNHHAPHHLAIARGEGHPHGM